MQGKATLMGHPIHPMLVPIPIGSFVGAFVADILYAATNDRFWPQMSVALISFGLVGAVLAGIVGYIDYRTAPMSNEAKSTGKLHMYLNIAVTAIFAIVLMLRSEDVVSEPGIAFTVVGVLFLAASGALGGHLSYHFGIGVDDASAERAAATNRAT